MRNLVLLLLTLSSSSAVAQYASPILRPSDVIGSYRVSHSSNTIDGDTSAVDSSDRILIRAAQDLPEDLTDISVEVCTLNDNLEPISCTLLVLGETLSMRSVFYEEIEFTNEYAQGAADNGRRLTVLKRLGNGKLMLTITTYNIPESSEYAPTAHTIIVELTRI